ncbi:MAG: rRNA maturation RNase YbeY [Phototrophicaceae bacterium]|jgi:probable rRNA maturation factor
MTDDVNYVIEVQRDGDYAVNVALIQQAVAVVLAMHDIPAASSLTVRLTENDVVQALNGQFRAVDSVTDVLSFPSDDLFIPEGEGDEEAAYLGDLAVAYPYVVGQAQSLGFDLNELLALLAVHGTLHLLGYDHDSDHERADMWDAQAEALDTLGISQALVPALEDAPHDDQ